MNSLLKKMGLWKVVLVLFGCLFWACGSDSSSSSSEAPDSQLNSCSSEEGADSASSSSVQGQSVANVENLDLEQFKTKRDSVVKGEDGTVYGIFDLGPATWIAENLNVLDPVALKSTCYGYDDKYCEKYGRLYMYYPNTTKMGSLCPIGYSLPSVGAWKTLIEKTGFADGVFSGICEKKDTLVCNDLDKSTRFLTYDGSAFVLTKGDDGLISYNVEKVDTNGFYSIRCIRYHTFVETDADMPECDTLVSGIPMIFVASRGGNLQCSARSGKWESNNSQGECLPIESGETVLINGLIFRCDGKYWTMPTIDDLEVPCTKDSLYNEYMLNEKRYVCLDSGWHVLTKSLESKLGYCGPHKFDKIVLDDEGTYVCDSTGWQRAKSDEVLGDCGEENKYDFVVINGSEYLCDYTGEWRLKNGIEEFTGFFCTNKTFGEKVYYGYRIHECTETGWRGEKILNYLGYCDRSNVWDTVMIRDTVFMCNGLGEWQRQALALTFGLCTEKNIRDVKRDSADVPYVCEMDRARSLDDATLNSVWGWYEADDFDVIRSRCREDTSFVLIKDERYYECKYGEFSNRSAKLSDHIGECVPVSGQTVRKTMYKGVEYVCDYEANENDWKKMNALDSAYGYCRKSLDLETHVYSDTTEAVCTSNSKNEYEWTIRPKTATEDL
ncbi:MAG: hypothetical protein J6U20_14105 [Fibrobacter sp.]|nr:hypothetical protein [Fibrobacter sp.]